MPRDLLTRVEPSRSVGDVRANEQPEGIMAKRIRHDRCWHPYDKATRDACAKQQREYDEMIASLGRNDR